MHWATMVLWKTSKHTWLKTCLRRCLSNSKGTRQRGRSASRRSAITKQQTTSADATFQSRTFTAGRPRLARSACSISARLVEISFASFTSGNFRPRIDQTQARPDASSATSSRLLDNSASRSSSMASSRCRRQSVRPTPCGHPASSLVRLSAQATRLPSPSTATSAFR